MTPYYEQDGIASLRSEVGRLRLLVEELLKVRRVRGSERVPDRIDSTVYAPCGHKWSAKRRPEA